MSKMNKKTWAITIGAIIVTIIYCSYNITLGYDSSQYIWLAEMFTPNLDFVNWEPVRSFVFPLAIYLLNILFGKSQIGLLIGTYICYLIMIASVYFMYKNTIEKEEKSKILKGILIFLFFILVAFNPIIFGFYHVILTEFASVTIAILMSYLAWNWIHFDFKTNKLKYVIYTIVFAFLTVCSWHLKQTYILTSIVPLCVAIIISLIEKFKKENILQRLIVLAICAISLVISIIGWNYILKVKNVKMEKSTSSEGLLGRTITEGVTEYRADPNEENYTKEKIEKDERLNEEDRKKILEILDNKSEEYKGFILLDKGTYMNPEGQRKVIYTKEKDISVGEGIGFVVDTLIHEPVTLFKSYISNYLGIIDIFDIKVTTEYGNYYYIDKNYTLEQDTEITFLGYCIYRNNLNALDLPDHYAKYAQEYISVNKYIEPINNYMIDMMIPAKAVFKFVMLLLPVIWLIKIISYFITRKKYNETYLKTTQLTIILYTYAFAQMMMYTLLGSLMDRYALAPFTATLIALLFDLYLLIRKKKMRLENGEIRNEFEYEREGKLKKIWRKIKNNLQKNN